MRRLLAWADPFLAFGAQVWAQEEVPLEPKAPKGASEATMLISDAARTAGELKEVEVRLTETESRAVKVAALMEAHDAQYPSGKCEYTESNPTACAPWIEEARVLNSRMDYLANLHEQQVIEKMEFKAYLNRRLARLRIMVLLDGLNEWERHP